jgi:CubicO group peptidase (beta-lactamase class C family)
MQISFIYTHKVFSILLILALISCQKEQMIVDLSIKENILNIIMAEKNIQDMNSVSFCVVKSDSLLWVDAMGYADNKKRILAVPETRYLIASISKSITAVAIMQLYERGLFALDDDINNYLPFKVTNPNHPADAITFRMLLNHTSSLNDNFNSSINLYCWGFDCPKQLGDFLHDFFSPEGKNYSKDNFYTYKPGEKLIYSNSGYVFLGYLVEVIAQKPFDIYCKENIFGPLGMTKTEWRLSNIPLNELAIPYSALFTPSSPHYTFIDYPDGGLRTTVVDLSKFLRMIIMNGSFNEHEIIKPETVVIMKQSTNEMDMDGYTYGLGLLFINNGNLILCGHDGGEQGVTSQMFYDLNSNAGTIVFTNTTMSDLSLITNALIQYGIKQ